MLCAPLQGKLQKWPESTCFQLSCWWSTEAKMDIRNSEGQLCTNTTQQGKHMSQECLASGNMVSFAKSCQKWLFLLPGWKAVQANEILDTIEKAGEDNENHDITMKRSNLSGLTGVSLSPEEIMYVIYHWPYLKLFSHSGVTLRFFRCAKNIFGKLKSLGNVDIWWKNWTTSVISFKGTKTPARSCTFTNAKLPREFVGTKLVTQNEFKWKIGRKRTVQFIKSFDAEQGRMQGAGKIRSLPNLERRKTQGASRKAVASGWQWHYDFTIGILQQSSNAGSFARNA